MDTTDKVGDELALAGKRGYAMGYAAGRRWKNRENEARVRESAFWQRAMLAALPAAFNADGWTRGNKPITALEDRMRLAADAADSALTIAKRAGKV